MRRLTMLFVWVLATAGARAEELIINAVEINGYGLFEASSSTRKTGYSRATMAADTVRGVKFTEFTDKVPGEIGTNFGLNYIINTTPRGQQIDVTQIIRFPEPGMDAPGGRHYTESTEDRKTRIGEPTLHGYGFDESWEIIPGEWVFEVWHGKAMLVKKSFTVVDPGTEIAGAREN